jgi:hypothetical protein
MRYPKHTRTIGKNVDVETTDVFGGSGGADETSGMTSGIVSELLIMY